MKKIKANFFLLLFSLALFSCHQAEKKESENKKDTMAVQSNADTSSFAKNLSALTMQLNADPKNSDLYYSRAKLYLDNKNFSAAQSDITQALNMDSTKADYYLILADLQFANYKLKNATASFEKSLKLDPKNIQANLKLAELYLYLKGYPKVFEYADAALKIDKHTAKAYFIKGFAFAENGDTTSAISSLQTVVELEPNNFDAYMELGNLFEAKHSKLAFQYYDNALRIKPNDLLALYDRSNCYQEFEDYNKAIEGYYAILKIDSNYADAHYNLGYIHLVFLKVYNQAIKHFTDAIRAKPDYYEAWYNRGFCYENLGNIAAAKENYEEALKLKLDYELAKKGLVRVKQ